MVRSFQQADELTFSFFLDNCQGEYELGNKYKIKSNVINVKMTKYEIYFSENLYQIFYISELTITKDSSYGSTCYRDEIKRVEKRNDPAYYERCL